MKSFSVTSHTHEYEVVFYKDFQTLLPDKEEMGRFHVLLDAAVYKTHRSKFVVADAAKSKKVIVAKEQNKTLMGVQGYIEHLMRHGVQKQDTLVVVGGGLVQDIGSFAAHILMRGLSWIFVPTTLLSMADSCIGSKSAINVGRYKNQVGSFHPPKEVRICTQFIKTLSPADIHNGKGEIFKHAIIKGGTIFRTLVRHAAHIPKDVEMTQRVIYQSLQVKKEIVEEDEFERGRRKLLNYGHTFGHAFEGYTSNKIPHGIAVTIGMDLANYISVKRGMLRPGEYETMASLLRKNIPYQSLVINDIPRYVDFLSRDKKASGNSVSALLSRGIGRIELTSILLDKQLKTDIRDYVISYNHARQ